MLDSNQIPDWIPSRVSYEILDEKFSTLTHGKRSCYSAGCRGPLCLLAHRLENREKYKRLRARRGLPYRPDKRVRVEDDSTEVILDWYHKKLDILSLVARSTA